MTAVGWLPPRDGPAELRAELQNLNPAISATSEAVPMVITITRASSYHHALIVNRAEPVQI
jgi:hypothetical protein